MPLPKLPAVITPSLLSSVRGTSRLPPNVWYILAGVTLSTLNRPEEIPKVVQFALENGIDASSISPPRDQDFLQMFRRLREGLVESSAIVGLPKTINALYSLKRSTPQQFIDSPDTSSTSPRSSDLKSADHALILQRGQAFFDKVYGKISGRVMSQMDNSGTPDLGVAARVAYGHILSGAGGILKPHETSCVVLASLIPQDVGPQLKGHLKGAVNNGATVDEVKATRAVCVQMCEAAGMKQLKGDESHAWGWTEDIEDLPSDWARL